MNDETPNTVSDSTTQPVPAPVVEMGAAPESVAEDTRSNLVFDDDKGSSRSTWIASVLLIAIIAWMGSGFVIPSEDEEATTVEPKPAQAVAVAVRPSAAQAVTLYFQAEGQAQPDRDTVLRAEASGDVAEVLVRKGDDVEEGDVVARLTTGRADADLRRAMEERTRAQRELDNSEALLQRGVTTADRVAQARATLAAAQAQVTAAEETLESADIVAPFAGRIETLSLDAGEFVSAGSDVGRLVDNTPLTVSLQVPQQALNRIRNGLTAEVKFITGETRQGNVTFVSTSASSETRTFLTEIEVPNPDGAIPAGISAEIRIPTGEQTAHFISPSVVSLSPNGETGVKVVEDGKVVFHTISVVRAEVDGIWVTGMPPQTDIITIGQGFVRNGEMVDARPESAPAATEQSNEEPVQ